MGFFDSIKNALGGKKEPEPDVTTSPSQVLREAGIDPSGIKFGFGQDGTVTVSGTVADDAERGRVVELVSGINGVTGVNDQLSVAPPSVEPVEIPAADPEPQVGSVDAPGGEAEVEGGGDAAGTYTVQPGDSLWKIAEQHYGSGANYMKIYEANTDILENPDKIFPGQELVIPDLDS